MFKIGYNTNGFASHSLVSAVEIIGSMGYESVALTIDHHALNPYDSDGSSPAQSRITRIRELLENHGLASVVETGARFLLDPWKKHEPTLISEIESHRQIRIDFLEKCIHIAAGLGAEVVSIWSGKRCQGMAEQEAWAFLVSGCREVCDKALQSGVVIGFEPEPGMFVENLDQYQRLRDQLNHPAFRLTLDLGHALITEKSIMGSLVAFRNEIVNIHLEDMKKSRHEHLFFGEGEMDFKEIFSTLGEIGYEGQVNIELSRHSPDAVETAKRALTFVREIRQEESL